MKSARSIAGELALMLVIAAVLVALGPFGTDALPLTTRIVDWVLFAVGGYVCFRPVIAGGQALARQLGAPSSLTIGLACILASLPTTLIVAWVFAGAGVQRATLGDLAGLYPRVLLIGAVATAVQYLIQQRRAERAEASAGPAPEPVTEPSPPAEALPAVDPPSPAAPPFLDRLPGALGRELLALENEDHYVRAHTAHGSTLILMRLGDAVAELAGIDGARVHRSWWVARAAVAETIRRDRAVALRLTNGLEVPVARAMAPILRGAGWL